MNSQNFYCGVIILVSNVVSYGQVGDSTLQTPISTDKYIELLMKSREYPERESEYDKLMDRPIGSDKLLELRESELGRLQRDEMFKETDLLILKQFKTEAQGIGIGEGEYRGTDIKSLSISSGSGERPIRKKNDLIIATSVRGDNRKYDSRFELLELNMKHPENIVIGKQSFSVYAMILKENLEKTPEGKYRIVNAETSGSRFNLCSNEPYRNQLSVAVGTAFLIGPDVLITAFHCVEPYDLKNIYFVTDYRVLNFNDDTQIEFNESDVEQGIEIINDDVVTGHDIAKIRLKRIPSGRTPLVVETSYKPTRGDQVYTLGYPLGLPMKLATNGDVSNYDEAHFETTLDTYQGNSGSPVFSRVTHKVIGVLVGGLLDFVSMGDCNVSNICYSKFCPQEKAVYLRSDLVK